MSRRLGLRSHKGGLSHCNHNMTIAHWCRCRPRLGPEDQLSGISTFTPAAVTFFPVETYCIHLGRLNQHMIHLCMTACSIRSYQVQRLYHGICHFLDRSCRARSILKDLIRHKVHPNHWYCKQSLHLCGSIRVYSWRVVKLGR